MLNNSKEEILTNRNHEDEKSQKINEWFEDRKKGKVKDMDDTDEEYDSEVSSEDADYENLNSFSLSEKKEELN